MGLKVNIQNYKSIQNATIELRSGLNILIGPNGSGKTCLLSSLKFLRDVFRIGAAQALARQGGARRVYHRGSSNIGFSFSQSYGERTYHLKKIPTLFHWEISISQSGPEKIATIIKERIEINGVLNDKKVRLFSTIIIRKPNKIPRIKTYLCSPSEFGRDLFSSWKNDYYGKNKQQISEHAFKAKYFSEVIETLKAEPDRSYFPIIAMFDDVFGEIYSNLFFLNEYNIIPEVARSSTEQLPFAQMSPDGGAVSEVIDSLEKKRYNKFEQLRFIEMEESYQFPPIFRNYRLSTFFGRSPVRFLFIRRRRDTIYKNALENINKELSAAVKPIINVSVSIDQTNGRRFVVFKTEDTIFFPEEVSDGTIKWLCILVSLFVPFTQVYLLEEPENFLHPWMQQRLIKIMREQSKTNGTIFLLSSHSSTILNGAYPEEVLIVKQTDRGTKISEMSDLDEIKNVLSESDFHVGDLWVSGAIGGVPSDD